MNPDETEQTPDERADAWRVMYELCADERSALAAEVERLKANVSGYERLVDHLRAIMRDPEWVGFMAGL